MADRHPKSERCERLKSEDEIGAKWDRCISDTMVKMGAGVGVGILFSLLMFSRRQWPIVFGLGSGFGMGFANCQHEFNQPFQHYRLKRSLQLTAKADNKV